MAEHGRAWPLAGADLTNQVSCSNHSTLLRQSMTSRPQILEVVQQAGQYKQLKKGANEGELRLMFAAERGN